MHWMWCVFPPYPGTGANMKKVMSNIEEYIGGTIFLIMLIVLVVQIFSRQFLNIPLRWSEELSRFLFVYAGYFGVSASIKDNGHVFIDFFVKKFPQKIQVFINLIVQTLSLLVLIAMFIIGIQMTIRKIPVKIVSLNISYAYMYIALPLIGAMMIYRHIERNLNDFRAYRKRGH